MIGSEHILSGYVILRGSFQIHIPMCIAMLIFIRPPDEECQTFWQGAALWYNLAVFQHILLSLVHMNAIYIDISGWPLFLESIKIMAIIAEVLNFIMAMILFINSPPSHELKPEENSFKIWVMLEMLMIASLVLANIFYVFVRTWERNKITISLT